MESVPNEVKEVYGKAEIEHSKKRGCRNLLSARNFISEEIERNEHYGEKSAINIRHNIASAASDRRFGRGQMVCDKVENIEI